MKLSICIVTFNDRDELADSLAGLLTLQSELGELAQ